MEPFKAPEYTSAMNLADLTEDCQVHLYNRMYLTDSFNLRSLCRPLNVSFFTHTRTLKLLVLRIGPSETAVGPNDIVCGKLNRSICNFLLATFPSITHLAIHINGTDHPHLLDQIATLLDGWSEGLVSLELDLNFRSYDAMKRKIRGQMQLVKRVSCLTASMEALLVLVNGQMAKLTSLTLKCSPILMPRRLDLPILGQLTEFQLNSAVPLTSIYSSLVTYAMPNEALRRIQLTDVGNDHRDRLALLQLDATFTRRFTSLGKYLKLTGPELLHYAPKFSSLTSLFIEIYQRNSFLQLDQLTSTLATHLPQLATLRLALDFATLEMAEDDDDDDPDPLVLSPLPSVTTLQLEFEMISHNDIRKYLNPAVTFPNLQKATTVITYYDCIFCPKAADVGGLDDNITPECRALLELPFEECPAFIGPVEHAPGFFMDLEDDE